MKKLKTVLALFSNAMLLGLLLLIYLDGRNPYMAFLTSGVSKVYLVILCLLGLTNGILILAQRGKGKE